MAASKSRSSDVLPHQQWKCDANASCMAVVAPVASEQWGILWIMSAQVAPEKRGRKGSLGKLKGILGGKDGQTNPPAAPSIMPHIKGERGRRWRSTSAQLQTVARTSRRCSGGEIIQRTSQR